MNDLIFWNTIMSFGVPQIGTGLIAALLATYAVCKLIEFEKYGPCNILYAYEWAFEKLFNDDCIVCISFWVSLTMMYLMPSIIVYSLSGVGFFIALELIGGKE